MEGKRLNMDTREKAPFFISSQIKKECLFGLLLPQPRGIERIQALILLDRLQLMQRKRRGEMTVCEADKGMIQQSYESSYCEEVICPSYVIGEIKKSCTLGVYAVAKILLG